MLKHVRALTTLKITNIFNYSNVQFLLIQKYDMILWQQIYFCILNFLCENHQKKKRTVKKQSNA